MAGARLHLKTPRAAARSRAPGGTRRTPGAGSSSSSPSASSTPSSSSWSSRQRHTLGTRRQAAFGAAGVGSSGVGQREPPTTSNPLAGSKSSKRYRGKRPKIAVDVDEVLAQFLLSLNKYYDDRFSKQFELAHYDEYYFCKVWDCTPELSNDIVHQFFDSHYFRDGIVPVPGALGALRRLQHKCDLVVITSRQNAIREATERWVAKHYPDVFGDLYFCNHFALDGESVSKADMCARVGADLLIDDNPGYALDCAESGLDVILFDYQGTYPWSKACADHERISKCADWEGILAKVDDLYFLPTLPPIEG